MTKKSAMLGPLLSFRAEARNLFFEMQHLKSEMPERSEHMELKGRVALITGGAGGIGGAVVRTLAKNGVSGIAINYRKSNKDAEALAAEIERAGVKAMAIQADVQKRRSSARDDREDRRRVRSLGYSSQ